MKEIVDAVRFAIEEVARISALAQNPTKESMSVVAKEIGLSFGVPSKLRRPNYMWGHAADQRIAKVIEDWVRSDKDLCGRISANTYCQVFRLKVADHGLDQGKSVDGALIRRLLTETKAEVIGTLQTCRYYFPAFCIHQEKLDEFTLGAATFIRPEKFFEQARDKWSESTEKGVLAARQSAALQGKESDGAHVRELFAETETELKKYPWLVSVEIENVERTAGWQKARQAVELACTILRLCLQRSSASFIGIGDESQLRRSQNRFCVGSDGEFHPTNVRRWIDVAVSADFTKDLVELLKRYPELEVVAKRAGDWTPLSGAQSKLQAGLKWFGEAWKDRQADARLVKFAICLEGVFMTGSREGITEILAERVAMLCEDKYEGIAEVYRDVRAVYDGRSKTVHGGAGNSTDFEKLSHDAERLATKGLLAFAELCPHLPSDKTMEDALKQFFTTLKLGGFQEALKKLRSSQTR